MFPFNFVRWLRSRIHSRGRTIVKRPRFRLNLETLEDRLAPAQFIWTGGSAGNTNLNWSVASNWLGGVAPTNAGGNGLADLDFGNLGGTHLAPVNNLTNLQVNSIQISSLNNYNITGNKIILGSTSAPGSGIITVGAGLTGEVIDLDMQLAATNASQQFFTVHVGASLTLSGKLTGSTGSQLTKEGAGTLILTDDNSGYTGPFNINHDAGIVRISHNKALGASSNLVTVGNNAQLQLVNIGAANPVANSLLLFGAGAVGDGSLYNLAGNNVWSGTVTMGTDTSINVGTGGVQSVTVTSGGSGYTAGGTPTVSFSGGGGGSGATAVAIMDTNVTGVTIAAAGSGYQDGTLTFGTPGSGATATYTVNTTTGAITGINLTNGGTGYNLASPPTITINDPGGAGTGANLTAVLNRFVASVAVTNPGFGYTSAPGVSFSGGGGSGTAANAAIQGPSTLTISGVLSDLSLPFNLTKIGQGTLILQNANTYRGTTTVENGMLTIQHPQALGAVPEAGTSVVRNTTLGTIGTLQLQFNSAVAPNGPADPQYWTLQDPSLAFNATTNPYVGFVVNDVPLTLNAAGFSSNGSLWNRAGNNTWTGTITLGSPGESAPPSNDVVINVDVDASAAQTRLFVTGIIQDPAPPTGPFNLIKIGQGDLVLAPTDEFTGAGTPNLFKGTTSINAGTITLRDSQGFGPNTKRHPSGTNLPAGANVPIVTVADGASLNLESNVGHVDSVTGTINRLDVSAPISITGAGYNNLGAIHSISGINTYSEKFVPSPTQLAASGVPSGGLTVGTTYYYVVTAIDGYGESLASNEQSFTATAGNRTARITWNTFDVNSGVTGYRIYRSTTQATYGNTSRVTTVNGNSGATMSFNDGSATTGAGTPPQRFPIIAMAGDASIGVEPDPNPTPNIDYFTNDYSLTITGGISDSATQTLTKVGAGHLILPNANLKLLGNTTIDGGWITIEDPHALGGPNLSVQEVQPLVKVNNNAALMFKPFAKGTSFTFTHNLSLTGIGIAHPFEEINFQGSLENLAGVNTVNSNILLNGAVGIGVEDVFDRSNLVLIGEQSQGQAQLNFAGDAGGNRRENIGPAPGQNPVNTGSTSGRLVLNAFVHGFEDDIRIYLGNWKLDPTNAILIYDASNDFTSTQPDPINQNGASITIDYTPTSAIIDVVHINDPFFGGGMGNNWLYGDLGPQTITYAPVSGPYATWLTIVVNPGDNPNGGITQWTYNATISPTGSFGGIIKLGSQRLDIQGPGTYQGGVDIQEGVVKVENNTALGAPFNAGTTVHAGTGLELANTVPDQNGGQSIGVAIWDTPLYLSGTGNAEFGVAPLSAVGKDNYWHGPITLNPSIMVAFQGALANTAFSNMTSNDAGVTIETATPGGGGLNAVQSLSFTGLATGDTFTLTFDDGVNSATTSNITYSTNPNTLIANILARLIALSNIGSNDVGVSLVSPNIDINPNTRLIVSGEIDDGSPAVVSPLIHDYQLNGSYADAMGGPSLVPVGGSLGGSSFTWAGVAGNNEGLTLTGALPDPTSYSVEMVFNFSGVFPPPLNYYRILDFSNRTSDNGLYVHVNGGNQVLMAYPGNEGTANVFATGVNVHLVVTRSSAGTVVAYINGVSQFSFVDSTNDFVQTGNILHFFLDDLAVKLDEVSGGVVDKIRIYSRALNAGEVNTVFNNGSLSSEATGFAADLALSGGGSLLLSGNNTYRGTTFVNEGVLSLLSGTGLGGIGVVGQQSLALTNPIAGVTQFTLTFPGTGTTAPVTYQGNASDAANIQTALRNLLGVGNVSVIQANAGFFLVTFTGTLAGTTTLLDAKITSAAGTGIAGVSTAGGTYVADKAQLQLQGGITVSGEPLVIQGAGYNLQSAVQTFTVGSTDVIPSGTFSLNFNGAATDTGPLPFDVTAGQLQAALQNLSTVKNVGGQVEVSVAKIFAGTNEEQRITFLGYNAGDTYQLYWDPDNGIDQLGFNVTPPITYLGNGNMFQEHDQVVLALSQLKTVTDRAGSISGIVSSVGIVPGGEYIAYLFTGGLADQPVALAQVRTLTGGAPDPVVTAFIPGATGTRTFNVEFQGAFAGLAQPNLTLGASGVTGSTTLTTPTTIVKGGTANATPIQWFAQGPAPLTNAVVNAGTQPNGNQVGAGRVTGVATQGSFADDIYISSDGGFWRTIDGGKHWTPVFDSILNSIIVGGAVTIAVNADSNVYFGTGAGNNSADSYYGSGVYLASTHADSATTLTKLLTNPDGSNPLAGKAINKIVVNPNNSLMIWVAVSDLATNGSSGNAGIWRYDGVNWLNLFSTNNTNFAYSDVAIENNFATLRLYAALGTPGGSTANDILVSDNPAAPTPTFNASTFKGAVGAGIGTIKVTTVPLPGAGYQFGTAYAAVSNTSGNSMDVWVTTNGGGSWAKTGANPANFLSGQGNYSIAIAAKRVGGANLIFVGGHDGGGSGTSFVIRSANGGGAWTNVTKDGNSVGPHTDIHALAIDRNDNLVAGTDGGVWRFDNAAGTWADLNGDLNNAIVNTVSTQATNYRNILAGTQGSGLALFDGASTWIQVNNTQGIDSVRDVQFTAGNPNLVFANFFAPGSASGRTYYSIDGGASWTSTSTTGAAQSIDQVNSNRLIAGSGNVLIETTNAGNSWSNINLPGAVSFTMLGAASYQGTFLADPFFPDIVDIGANTYVPDTIYFANANNLFVTKDHGVTVTGTTIATSNRTPPLAAGTNILDIQVDPSNSNVVYVVTSGRITTAGTGRVFKTIDSGLNWTDVSAGLPLSAQTGSVMPAWRLTIDSRTNDLYLGTDEGVWKLTGGTGNWQRFGAGLPIVPVKDIDLNTSANVLTIATYGRGVWQLFLDDNTLANAPVNPGALRSIAGNNTWTGPITLAGPTTISANGSQALQNGLSAATLTLLGVISDSNATTANTLTKVGGGDVILSAANTYAGVTDIQQGNLVIKNANTLGGTAVAGQQALSIFQTPAPTQNTPTLSTGGTIANGTTYSYVITAVGPQGESIASNERTITTTALNQQINLSWTGVAGATSYKVYRTTVAGTYGATSLLKTINSPGTVTYSDTGADAVAAGTPPISQFTLALGTATTAPINYTGVGATDAASIASALNASFFAAAGFTGDSATVAPAGPGVFLITFGGSLAGKFQPMFNAAITSGFGSASITNGGGTIVENGAALVLDSSLYLEPVTLNGNGIQPSYSGHNTGALRSRSNANTYTGNLTLNTNATIGVDTGSTLTIASATPIVLTSANHGLQTGYHVNVAGVLGNTGANGAWTVTVVDANHFSLDNSTGNEPYVSGGTWTLTQNISAATAATPLNNIVITSANHGLATGNLVTISGVLGNTTANGKFTITKVDDNKFSLNGTAGSPGLTYTGGGLWLLAHAITGATNANPIVVTSTGHGLSAGAQIVVSGVQGNLAANGPWTIANPLTNSFQLAGSDGTASGSYVANTGIWTLPVATGTITATTNPIGITDNGVGYALEKEGAGTLIFTSPATYGSATAGTTVNQGILNIQHSNALGVAGSTTTVRDGAQLQLQTSAAGQAVNVGNENLVLSGSGITGTGALLNVSGNNSWGTSASTVTLTAVPGFGPTTTPSGTVAIGVAGLDDNLTIGSPIVEPTLASAAPTAGPLPMGLSKVGAGRLILGEANTYSGTTYVNTGILRIQDSDALGTNGDNEIQRITMFDPLGTNTFTLTFNGQTTASLPFGLQATGGATPTSSVQNALGALSSIGSIGITSNVDVERQTITLVTPSGTQTGYAYTVTFARGPVAGKDQPLIVATPSAGLRILASRVLEGGIGTLVSNGASLELDGDPTNTSASISIPASERLALNGTGSNRIYPITAASLTGSTVTLTTASTAGLFTGEYVTIAGFTPNGYNGNFVITVIDATHFSYTVPTSLAAVTTFGTAAPSPGALHNVTGNNTWAGSVTLQTSSSVGVDAATQLTVAGTVQDPAPSPMPAPIPPADLTKVGVGTLVFPNANTYTGNTYINSGIVNIRNNNSLGANTSAVQVISVFGSSGTFSLSYNGTPISPDLSFGASAADVKAALDAAIQTSTGNASNTVTVTQLGNNYTVFFNGGALAGEAQPLLTGSGSPGISVLITPTQLGAQSDTLIKSGAALQLQGGIVESTGKALFLNGSGPAGAGALENVAGSNSIGVNTPVILQSNSAIGADGSSLLTLPQQITDERQVQTLNLSVLPNGSQYTVSFGGLASGTLTYNNSAGARAATAAALQSALNGLATIALNGGVVTVPTPSSPSYNVTFGGRMIGTNWPAIVLTRLSTGATFLASPITMVSGGFGVDKVGTGTVQYTGTGANLYTGLTHVIGGSLELNKPAGLNAVAGDLTVGSAGVAEVQTITITGTAGTFALTFNGATTGDLPFDVPASGGSGATASIQNALNALPTIGGVGGTAVVTKSGNVYTVTFGGNLLGANLPQLVLTHSIDLSLTTGVDGSALANEMQALTVTGNSGTFTLTFDGETTGNLPYNVPAQGGATATSSIQNALNALPSIGGVGGSVIVTKLGNVFTIVFGDNLSNTDVQPITFALTPILTIATPTDGSPAAGSAAVNLLQPNQIVNSSDVLVNGNGALHLNNNNEDLGTTLRVVDGLVTTGTANLTLLASSALNMTGGIIDNSPSGIVELRGGVAATSTFTGPATIQGGGTLDLHGLTRTFTVSDGPQGSDLVISTVIDDLTAAPATGLTKAGAGRLELGAVNDYPGITRINAGDVQVDTGAQIGNVSLDGGSVSGRGNVGTIAMQTPSSTGTVNPGYNGTTTPYGILNSQPVTLNSNSTFFVDLRNSTPGSPPTVGTDYDRLNVTGNVILGNGAGTGAQNALLLGSPGAGIQIGDSFTILQTTGGTVTGLFDGIINGVRNPIPDNGTVFLNGQKYIVDYFSDKVVLTRQLAVFTSFTIVADYNASVYGQEVTYTVTAVPEAGATLTTAAPLITFTLDAPQYTYAMLLNSSGVATYSPQSQHFLQWAPGVNHTITASFTDANVVFAPATPTGSPITQIVNKNTVQLVTTVANPSAPVYGQDVSVVQTIIPTVIPDVAGASNPTGNVQFIVDSLPAEYIAIFPYAAPPLSQTAILQIPGNTLLNAGTHAIQIAYLGTPAVYNGDANYAPSGPITFNLDIAPDQSDIVFNPVPPAYLGQPAHISLDVVPVLFGSTGQPVGTLDIYDGPAATGTPLNGFTPIPYNGTTVDFSTVNLTLGNHQITVKFTPAAGNNNYLGKIETIPYVVNPATTTTTILNNFTPATPVFGQPVTFNFQVVPAPAISYGPPTGTVTLWDGVPNAVGSINLGTGAINSGTGLATVTTLGFALSQGNHTLYANYNGDGQYAQSIGTRNITIGETTTFVQLQATPAGGASYGTSVNLKATVTALFGTPPAGVTPGTSIVTFVDLNTGATLGVANLTAGGIASINTTALIAASHSIRATYTDTFDTNFADSFTTLNNYVISNAPTSTVVLAPSPASSTFGMPVTLNARVSGPTAANPVTFGVPNSKVTFWDGPVGTGINLGTAMVVDNLGNASLTTSVLKAGTHNINAAYSDTADSFFLPSQTGNTAGTGALVGFVVSVAPTAITSFVSSVAPNAAALGQPVTYTATVKTQAPSPLAPVTAGTVTFFDNSIQIGSPVPVNSSGIASTPPVTYTTQLGTHTITAIYNPPTVAPINYAASAMVSLTQVVLKASGINVAPVAGNLYGQNLVYNVTFNTVPVGGTLTGTVVVTENGNPVSSGGGTLVSASSAVITIPGGALSQGSHNLVFTFTDTLGPPAYAPSSKSITQSVGAATSQVVFTPPLPTSILYGNTVDYSGVINTTTPNSRNPNAGTVKLFLDSTVGTPLATQAVSLTQELQELTIGGGTGTFTLTYNGFTTVALAWDVPPTGGTLPEDSLQNALNALPSIGGLGGSVNVSGTAGVSYLVEFGGSLAGVNVSQMSAASSDGANPSVSTLAPGSAGFSFTGVSLPATVTTGAHTIIAAFVPANSNHSASQASSPLSISKAGTTTAIVSSSTLVGPATYQSTYGDLVTFTATVTSSTTGSPAFGPASYSNATTTGVPLNFYIGNTLIAGTVTRTGTTANSATYALTTSSLKALLPPLFTPHTVKAFYRGNASFLATPTPQDTMQPSSVLFQIVDKASTSVALSSSAPGGSYVGKSVTFTAIVTSASGGTPTTSGATMKFYKDNGATFMGNGVLSSTTANSATYKFTTSTSALPPNAGGHQIVATYSGAANFLGSSNSPAFSQVVNKAVTTMTITSSPAVWATNSNTTFTITIKLAQGAAAINPGATVTLDDNGNGLPGVATWTAGTATTATYKYTMTTPFTPGAHTITAIYSGNANVEANSVSKSQADVRLLSRLSLVALGTPTAGQNVTFSATLTSLTGPVAGRAVTFTINGNTYTATTNASGVATVTGKFFTSGGTYPVSAAFTDPILNDAFASASVYVKPPTIGRLA